MSHNDMRRILSLLFSTPIYFFSQKSGYKLQLPSTPGRIISVMVGACMDIITIMIIINIHLSIEQYHDTF